MKIFAYHTEGKKPVSNDRGIDALATALKEVLSKNEANQHKHDFKKVEESLKKILEPEPIRNFVPDLKKDFVQSEFETVGTPQWLQFTKTHIVKFRQKYKNIPVYGAQVTVEVAEDNELLAINSAIGDPNEIDSSPKFEPDEIKQLIEEKEDYESTDLDFNPTLYYYYDSKNKRWRLVYITDIRFKETKNGSQSKFILKMVDYIIDAHTKEIVLELPRVRTLQKELR
ncbi:hypothetical protein A6S26_09795 [Nostoc sp. ATCC 43529]|nr:hypothetical protein A6S26_09795 [Nostoc sp. ATCC 43529]